MMDISNVIYSIFSKQVDFFIIYTKNSIEFSYIT